MNRNNNRPYRHRDEAVPIYRRNGVHTRRRSHRKAGVSRIIFLIIAMIMIGVSIFFVLRLVFILSKDDLFGRWAYDEITVYSFDGKGYGQLLLPSAEYGFEYSLEGDVLSIDFEDAAVKDAEYRIKTEKGQIRFTIANDSGESVDISLNRVD